MTMGTPVRPSLSASPNPSAPVPPTMHTGSGTNRQSMSACAFIVAPRVRRQLLWILGVLGLAASAPLAGAAAATPQPLQVQSASLTQQAQQLTWRLEMA